MKDVLVDAGSKLLSDSVCYIGGTEGLGDFDDRPWKWLNNP